MINRQEEIKKKGFAMTPTRVDDTYTPENLDFFKIKVGRKELNDAVLKLGDLKNVNPRLADKERVLKAIRDGDVNMMREISLYFYKTSGIYSRLCKYMANLYRYDWMITPYVFDKKLKASKDKVIDTFNNVLYFLDQFEVKRFLGEAALKVIKTGVYYGYLVPQGDRVVVQELPYRYCRSRFTVNQKPAVEFNFKYFNDCFSDEVTRMKILKGFPKEFYKAYKMYKAGKLTPDFPGDDAGWYLLDIQSTVKFNLNGDDFPPFIAVIPAILDLDAAQDLDRKKMAQKLLKIIIQKMPLDKNGDLVFDVDEAQQLHANAVKMIGKAIGVDVLTTFADVEVADMADRNSTTTVDDLSKVERTVFNESGTAQNLFNADGNLALDKSILNDEASLSNLILQFESFLNDLLLPFNKNKKFFFRAQILGTTIYNYKEMSKLYKEQTQVGYSKMLPQIALGHSQSSILATAYFENDMLDLVNVFIPPLSSNTMDTSVLKDKGEGGRPEKPDDQKSDKTIANRESMG